MGLLKLVKSAHFLKPIFISKCPVFSLFVDALRKVELININLDEFDYENHTFEIIGEAYPENSDEFFRPIMESLQEYVGNGSSELVTFVFKLIYFNSSSARVLMKLFEFLDRF